MDEMDAKKRASSLGSAGSLSSDIGSSDTPSKGMVMAALGVGVVGLLTGIIGIVMVNGTNSDLAALKEQVERTQDPQVVLKPTLDTMDEHINTVAANSTNSIKDINTKIQQIAQAIAADREAINRNTAALTGHRAPAAKVAVGGAAATAAAPTTTNAQGQKVHAIQAGETFSTLSRQYGVPVSAIQSANSGIDSSHLKIGQQVVIPEAK
jgi:LysM repeat protein